MIYFFVSSRRRHTICSRDWSSDVCSSDLIEPKLAKRRTARGSGLGVYRWVVERTESWLHNFRKLRLRTDTDGAMHKAFRSEERRVGKEGGSRWGRHHDTDVNSTLILLVRL